MRLTEAVSATDVVLSYEGRTAVASSTFTVPAGGVTVVIGPNGSGKSTLLNALAGLHQIESGALTVLGGRPDPTRISYVMQATKVNEALPISVREVVTMGRYAGLGLGRLGRDDRAAVDEAMRRAGILELGSAHLHDLSGGQRQRVFVAQGLAQEHDLLLLDEPLTGIDLPTARSIDEVIHEETGRGCTVIVTTHDLSEATAANHVLLLAGKVVAAGAPDVVLTRDNLATAYGPALVHGSEGQAVLDDPAHAPVPGRHVHRERSADPPVERLDH